jgi:hypothetical protein
MKQILETQLLKRIKESRGDVFLRRDFEDLGNYAQIGRALRELVKQERLMKIGFGLYSRTIRSPLDRSVVIPPNGLSTLREALNRVGIEVFPSRSLLDYNAGRTTQIPTGRVVGVKRRVRRKVGYNGFIMRFERAELAPN